ncbi:hypothetical protein FQA39_LY12625 [Lamprigera yunnana]|nr:hypothetical protein FQA39_LY12625 [Lamprigera yunnana]
MPTRYAHLKQNDYTPMSNEGSSDSCSSPRLSSPDYTITTLQPGPSQNYPQSTYWNQHTYYGENNNLYSYPSQSPNMQNYGQDCYKSGYDNRYKRDKCPSQPGLDVMKKRRLAANARERRRMNSLNDAFDRKVDGIEYAIWRKQKYKPPRKLYLQKKRKAVKEYYISLEEEEEEEILLDDSSDDATYWIPEVEPSAFEELDRGPEPHDFVLVQFKAKNNVFYVGKVLKLEKDTNDIKVNFLRKCVKFEGHFIFLPKPDIATVPVEDINFILPPRSLLGKTKRLQSYHKFEINFNHLNIR